MYAIIIKFWFIDLQEVLEKMLIEFQIKPSIYTLRNIVIPSIKRDYREILSLLLNSQVDILVASNATFLYLLSKNEIREAMSLCNYQNLYLGFNNNFYNLDLITFLNC